MSAQFINTLNDLKDYAPWLSFLAGLGGGLHCVGMCGGLVTASCSGHKDVLRYQLGRLLGYLSAGFIAGSLGSILGSRMFPSYVSAIGSFFMGGMFILWGVQALLKKQKILGPQKVLNKFYFRLWSRFVQKSQGQTRSVLTGLFSVLLPCGLLYSVVLGGVALQDWGLAVLSMLTFWLGTLPAMVFAPEIFRRILAPIRLRFPASYAIGLILIGLVTIGMRAQPSGVLMRSQGVEQNQACH